MAESKTLKAVSAEANTLTDYSNVFAVLNAINVNDKKEKKNGLTYLSWPWAWGEAKKVYPDASYKVYENANGWFYHTDGKTCWVKTGVTINGQEHIEYLPVMDNRNQSIPLENVTSVAVNKSIQRSLTKALARHGLGLYIYAGEDIPEAEKESEKVEKEKEQKSKPAAKEAPKPVTNEASKEERDRQDNIKACMGYREKIKEVGYDYQSSSVVDWCKKHSRTGITTMDLQKLTSEQIVDLCNMYAILYNNKKAAIDHEKQKK